MFKLSLVVVILAAYTAAQLNITTPTAAEQCGECSVTWRGGIEPFSIRLLDTANNVVEEIAPVAMRSPLQWIVNQSAGRTFLLCIQDSTGITAITTQFTVQPSLDSSCLTALTSFTDTPSTSAIGSVSFSPPILATIALGHTFSSSMGVSSIGSVVFGPSSLAALVSSLASMTTSTTGSPSALPTASPLLPTNSPLPSINSQDTSIGPVSTDSRGSIAFSVTSSASLSKPPTASTASSAAAPVLLSAGPIAPSASRGISIHPASTSVVPATQSSAALAMSVPLTVGIISTVAVSLIAGAV